MVCKLIKIGQKKILFHSLSKFKNKSCRKKIDKEYSVFFIVFKKIMADHSEINITEDDFVIRYDKSFIRTRYHRFWSPDPIYLPMPPKSWCQSK